MVSQVVDVIQEHVDPIQFKDFINTYYSVSPKYFVEALQFIGEYSTVRGVRIATGLRQQFEAANTVKPTNLYT